MSTESREPAESDSSASSVGASGGNAANVSKTKRQKQTNNSNNVKTKMRPVTVETVRRIVAQEGRAARNLISWNAPLDIDDKPKPARRPAVKRRSKSADTAGKKTSGKSASETKTSERKVSTGKRQVSIRARYWAYLFENLRRAVDEIYATCETDQSVVECKEVLLVLNNCRHDFQALIDWINLQERLNSTDVANRPTSLAWEVRKSSPGRPRQRMPPRVGQQAGIAISTASQMANTTATNNGIQPNPHIKRCLKFLDGSTGATGSASPNNNANSDVAVCASSKSSHSNSLPRTNCFKKTSSSSSTVTWADRVKGVQNNNVSQQQQRSPRSQNRKTILVAKTNTNGKANNQTLPIGRTNSMDEEDGWEKVSAKSKQAKGSRVHFTKVANGTRTSNQDVLKKEPIVAKDKNSNVIMDTNDVMDQNQDVTKNLDFFVESVGSTSLSTPSGSKEGTPEFSGIVVERSMGTASTSSYDDKGKEDSSLDKVLIAKDDTSKGNDLSLQTLDEVEAEFFKSEATLASDDEDTCVLSSMDAADSKANMALLDHEASIAAAEKEEEYLMKEIEAEENKQIDTEAATEIETPNVASSGNIAPRESADWNSVMARFEAEQEIQHGMSWGEMIDEEELREPGRAVQMHEKLSSPSRRRTPDESRRKMEEKQRSATLRRQKMVQDKTERIHNLTERVDDVKRLKADLIMGKTELLKEFHVEKLQRAEQQRALKLMKIVQKAQAEETKVNEILFINELQEQNKRHDVLNRILEHDARLQEIQQERSKMFEVKAAKEENVKERRRLLEKERQDQLSVLINKRKENVSRIEQLKQEREKEREKVAREKERDRRIRLSALNAAQQEAVTELQKKIQIKHDESERRHQEQLEQRKEKAVELSLGKFSLSSSGNMPSGEFQNSIYEGEKALQKSGSTNASLNLMSAAGGERETGKGDGEITSKSPPQDGATVISPRSNTSDEEKKLAKEKEVHMSERKKAMKKRAKKLKTRMTTRGRDFLKTLEQKQTTSSNAKNKVYRLVKDINRQLSTQKETSGPWSANRVAALDRALGEINRLLEKQDDNSKTLFRTSDGFEMLERVFEVPLNSTVFQGQRGEPVSIVPDKTVANAASTLKAACEDNFDNVIYVLYSSRFTILVDALTHQLTKHLPEEPSSSSTKSSVNSRKAATSKNVTRDDLFDPASSALLETLAYCIGFLASHSPTRGDATVRLSDSKLLRALKMTTMMSSKPSPAAMDDVDPKKLTEGFLNRGLDVVSFAVSCGVLDRLSTYLGSVRSEIESNSKAAAFIKNGLTFLYAITEFVALRNRVGAETSEGRTRHASTGSNASNSNDKTPRQNRLHSPSNFDPQMWDSGPTQLLPTLYHTEVMGVVSVLYGILLHGAPERPILLRNNSLTSLDDVMGSSHPVKKIPVHVLKIATSVMLVLNAVADLDIELLQESLGAEGVSLEFRHICTYLLWYCQQSEDEGLLHQVIVCVGHFALCNKKNQETVHSGAMPTVLQQLCVLPFSYFSNPRLSNILFPTLIACCHNNPTNIAMLEQEASSTLLSSYIKEILADMDNNNNVARDSHKAPGANTISKKRGLGSLSSSRFYTVPFLRNALHFFEGNSCEGHSPLPNVDTS